MFLSRRACVSSFTLASHRVVSIARRGASTSAAATLDGKVEFLVVSYQEKDEVKALGGRFDPETKRWYVPTGRDTKAFQKWMKVYLNVPYADKDEAKQLGAMWDKQSQKWFITGGANLSQFEKWMDENKNNEVSKPATQAPEIPIAKTATRGNAKTAATKTTKPKVRKEPVIPVAIIDIDTSGLPEKVNGGYDKFTALASYNPSRIVQLSYLICDLNTWEPIEKKSFIIRTDGFPIENAEFHGITTEISQNEGIPFPFAVTTLMTAIENSKYLIFHNAEFCLNILKSEFYRAGLFLELEKLPSIKPICIMERSKFVLGLLNVAGKPKPPSMKELLKMELNMDLPAVHTADMDVEYIRLIIKQWIESKKMKPEQILEN